MWNSELKAIYDSIHTTNRRMNMSIWKCCDCPYLARKEKSPWGHYWYCEKFKTKKDYNQSACGDMKGK